MENINNIVLGTVNKSWKQSIDTETLTDAIKKVDVNNWLIHLSAFFTEVNEELILTFANTNNIKHHELFYAYIKVKTLTGESNQHLENILGTL